MSAQHLPTQAESSECEAAFATYVKNLNGFKAHRDDFRAGWFMARKPSARVIHVEHVYPPIPVRGMDWRATFDGYEPGDPMGTGATEADAISSLLIESDYQGGVEIRRAKPAPTALEALESIVFECKGPSKPYSSDSYLPEKLIDQARAAIAAARGQV